ncbi:hypothetical protein FACS1894218_2440 [Bacilli bacterium]|nr:hypothetical protein FACS1894218_2440 [Bacilli bacterium]
MSLLTETYKCMLKSVAHECIHIIGDSAGGTLVLTLGQQLKLHKLPAPKNLICLSPLVDLQAIKHASPDPILPPALLGLTQK